MNILIVDDDEEIRKTLRYFFSFHGYDVITASCGKEALAIAEREKLYIVLLDIRMPDLDGVEVLSRIREKDFSVQVITMTGYSTFDTTLRALEKGAADYILKPFRDLNDLLRLVKIAEDRLNRWRQVLIQSSNPPPGNPTHPPFPEGTSST